MHPRDQLLRNRFSSKGSAFTAAERKEFGIEGWLPHKIETLEQQVARCEMHFDALAADPLQQWIYLTNIQNRNERLFYALVMNNIKKMLPIVYTPTVGQACARYSEIWRQEPRGLYLGREHRGGIRDILETWPHDVEIIVVTDGTRILGLGDLGAGGHQICVGKLALYTLGGGFNPEATLPISLDFGCCKPEIRDSPHYLGCAGGRVKDAVYYEMVEELVLAVKDKWPTCVFQFEDFSNDTAFVHLEAHRGHGLAVFNDDITGTGCVTAGAVLSGLRAAALKAGREVSAREQRVVMLGAGAGGIGVAERIHVLMTEEGLSAEEAYANFWIIDSRGLITADREDFRSGRIAAHKVPWARKDVGNEGLTDLLSVVKAVKPTILLGLSTIAKSFDEAVVAAVAAGCAEYPPIVMALSNPTSKAECTAQECMDFAKGHAVYASGSPFPQATRPDGTTVQTSQCNNLYVFPAIGLGSSICQASRITDAMISAVSHGLAEQVPEEMLANGELLPDIANIREISAHCAVRLIRTAEREGLARAEMPADDTALLALVRARQWVPKY